MSGRKSLVKRPQTSCVNQISSGYAVINRAKEKIKFFNHRVGVALFCTVIRVEQIIKFMKKGWFLIVFSLLSLMGYAQNDELQWFTNMDSAKTSIEDQERNILMVFSGSDWCRSCMQFKKDILEDQRFQEWGKDQVVILYLDFPARKKNRLNPEATAHNEALAERYNKSGVFPNIVLINGQEEIVSNLKFNNQSVDEFINAIPKD